VIRRAQLYVTLPSTTLIDLKNWSAICKQDLVTLAIQRIDRYDLTQQVEESGPRTRIYFNLDSVDVTFLKTRAAQHKVSVSLALSRAAMYVLAETEYAMKENHDT
jgi:hypothetical protein